MVKPRNKKNNEIFPEGFKIFRKGQQGDGVLVAVKDNYISD